MKKLDKIENAVAALLFLIALIVLSINVFLRAIGSGTSWSEELVRYLIIWITFVGASICVRQGQHVGIDVLPEYLPQHLKIRLSFVINVISLGFALFLAKYSVELVQFNAMSKQISPGLKIPIYIVYLALPIGLVLMSIRYVQACIADMKEILSSNR